jgi:hypothetical protein
LADREGFAWATGARSVPAASRADALAQAPWKVAQVRRGYHEDPDAAKDRHFAAHPEDRGANIVIFEFYADERTADEG